MLSKLITLFIAHFSCFCAGTNFRNESKEQIVYYEDLISTEEDRAFRGYQLPTSAEGFRPKNPNVATGIS